MTIEIAVLVAACALYSYAKAQHAKWDVFGRLIDRIPKPEAPESRQTIQAVIDVASKPQKCLNKPKSKAAKSNKKSIQQKLLQLE